MSYPERGAGYKHTPKFLDRAKAEEKRADGGSVVDRWKNFDKDRDEGGMGGALGALGMSPGSGLDLLGMATKPGGLLKAAGVDIGLKRGGSVDGESKKRSDRPSRTRKG